MLPHVSCVGMPGNEASGSLLSSLSTSNYSYKKKNYSTKKLFYKKKTILQKKKKLILVGSLIPRLTYWLFVVIGTAAFEKFSAGLCEGPESGGEVVSARQCHIVQ